MQIDQRDIRLGGAVELDHARHVEAPRELLPDVRPQAVAHGVAHAVAPVVFTGRLREQVAAHLADVLERRGAGFREVLPESGSR
jgi:hypothetical protein